MEARWSAYNATVGRAGQIQAAVRRDADGGRREEDALKAVGIETGCMYPITIVPKNNSMHARSTDPWREACKKAWAIFATRLGRV